MGEDMARSKTIYSRPRILCHIMFPLWRWGVLKQLWKPLRYFSCLQWLLFQMVPLLQLAMQNYWWIPANQRGRVFWGKILSNQQSTAMPLLLRVLPHSLLPTLALCTDPRGIHPPPCLLLQCIQWRKAPYPCPLPPQMSHSRLCPMSHPGWAVLVGVPSLWHLGKSPHSPPHPHTHLATALIHCKLSRLLNSPSKKNLSSTVLTISILAISVYILLIKLFCSKTKIWRIKPEKHVPLPLYFSNS